MNTYLQHFDNKNRSPNVPPFSVGDYLKIGFVLYEAQKKRVQFFEGIVIAINGWDKKVTLRRGSAQLQNGIERVFAYTSPQIQTVQILQSQKFRRSKLFYLRQLVGKASFVFQ